MRCAKLANVRLENLTKNFGQMVAVDRLSLEIADGSFTCLLGPSGCGKTTTLRMIAGLEFQDEGSVYFGDKCVDELSPGDRNISMVFQFYAIYPNMKVFDEIAFPLKKARRPDTEIQERVRKVAEMVGLQELLNERAAKLSVDQKQRVELARAIVKQPDVYLFDEPLTNLDASVRAQMRAEIARIQKELSTTTIYVTHDQLEAMALGTKIAIMNQGKLIQYEEPAVVYEKPSDLFVAGFIGTPPMNFIPCRVVPRDGSLFYQCDGFELRSPPSCTSIVAEHENREVTLGIRPENLALNQDCGPDSKTGIVDIIEPLGRRVIVNVKIGGTEIKVNSLPMNLSRGQEVKVDFPTSRLRVFENSTGKVIV